MSDIDPPTTESRPTKITILYLGLVEASDKKLAVAFYPLKAGWRSDLSYQPRYTDPGVLLFEKKTRNYMYGARPGTVWTVESPKEGSIKPDTFGLIDKWPVQEHIMQWQADDEVRQMRAVTRKESARIANEDTLKEALEPLRKLYHSSVGQHRMMLIARVVAYITS